MKYDNTNKRRCAQETAETAAKIHSAEAYCQTGPISFICRQNHIAKASMIKQNKRYDGRKESRTPSCCGMFLEKTPTSFVGFKQHVYGMIAIRMCNFTAN